jgi:hypothetical protein
MTGTSGDLHLLTCFFLWLTSLTSLSRSRSMPSRSGLLTPVSFSQLQLGPLVVRLRPCEVARQASQL